SEFFVHILSPGVVSGPYDGARIVTIPCSLLRSKRAIRRDVQNPYGPKIPANRYLQLPIQALAVGLSGIRTRLALLHAPRDHSVITRPRPQLPLTNSNRRPILTIEAGANRRRVGGIGLRALLSCIYPVWWRLWCSSSSHSEGPAEHGT